MAVVSPETVDVPLSMSARSIALPLTFAPARWACASNCPSFASCAMGNCIILCGAVRISSDVPREMAMMKMRVMDDAIITYRRDIAILSSFPFDVNLEKESTMMEVLRVQGCCRQEMCCVARFIAAEA